MQKIKKKYDVIILESGSAGHACAIRCAELGLKTLCIGTGKSDLINFNTSTNFENLSIISLLESAKLYESIINATNHGIHIEGVGINVHEMMSRKHSILENINAQLLLSYQTNKIDYISASAQVLDTNSVQVTTPDLVTVVKTKAIVLATDSIPISLPCARVDNEYILDSTSALNMEEIPKNIAILGAGIIGLEIAGIWNRLGSNIIILEAQDTFLNVTDHQISSLAYQIFLEQGLEIRLGTRVISTQIINKKVVVEFQDSEGIHAIKVDKLIVASGRRPNSENLAAPEANLLLDDNGFVHTDEEYKTNLPNVFAIGDLTMHGPMLSHKGIAEGYFVADKLAGNPPIQINYRSIPSVIYTEPEIAWVGQSEHVLKSMGESVKTANYHWEYNFLAKAVEKTAGIIKIITDSKTDAILGVHVIGSNASEIIAEASFAIEFSACSEDLTRAIHSHPSLNEAYHEVCSLLR